MLAELNVSVWVSVVFGLARSAQAIGRVDAGYAEDFGEGHDTLWNQIPPLK